MHLPKSSLMLGPLLVGCLSLFPSAAMADAYQLQVHNGHQVQKIFVDGGNIRRLGMSGQFALFDVEMSEGQCSNEVRVLFYNGKRLKVPYDVCSEAGFALKQIRR